MRVFFRGNCCELFIKDIFDKSENDRVYKIFLRKIKYLFF